MIVRHSLDPIQMEISSHLAVTEQLVTRVLQKVTGKSATCQITLLEDLGLANNLIRMNGGFFTGMHIDWDADVPFVPVDATVNACGVSIFPADKLSFAQFSTAIKTLEQTFATTGIKNNFNSGNHFISYCMDGNGDAFFVIHASNNLYKYGEKGLYPREDSWFADAVQTECMGNRYLRYLTGDKAIQFYHYYLEAESSNHARNRHAADILLGTRNIPTYLYAPHYGMPTEHSVAIGCQWQQGLKVLLSYTGQDVFVLDSPADDAAGLFPHGFGVYLKGDQDSVSYTEQGICINGQYVDPAVGILASGIAETRFSGLRVNEALIHRFLSTRDITVTKTLKQQFSYSCNGLQQFV